MSRKRNSIGQFIKDDGMIIRIPSFTSMLMYLIILLILSPWIYVFAFRLDIKVLFLNLMNYLFQMQQPTTKGNKYF